MSITTPEKRFAMMNFGDGSNIHLLPEPDGSIDADDRLHLLDLYPLGVSTLPSYMKNQRHMLVNVSRGGM